jgi:hypothetical protein
MRKEGVRVGRVGAKRKRRTGMSIAGTTSIMPLTTEEVKMEEVLREEEKREIQNRCSRLNLLHL